MSDNDADDGSQYDKNTEISEKQEESGSEYQSEDDASSMHSESSEESDRRSKTGTKRKRKSESPVVVRVAKPPKATYSDAYRDYYNDVVEELANPLLSRTANLPSSEIGVIEWTPLEKEILFRRIATLGRDNIKAVAEAIRSKSETEVRQYLTLLDQGRAEGNVTLSLPVFSAADVPAAFEVSKQSEDVLEEYADGLAQYQRWSDQKREKKRHGDYWLLTEDVAEKIEVQVIAREQSRSKQDVRAAEEHGQEKSRDDQGRGILENANSQGEQEILDEAPLEHQNPERQQGELIDELDVPAAELLDLPAWLRLSQLFMYQSPTSTENWNDFVTTPDETPSMYHTTFQDFYNLTTSLTRRLVQASIFQAMTRLRARDKNQPSAVVNSTDVRTASDILDLKRDRRKFWGSVPRRHGLRVYERGAKFSKGQSRSGVELGLDEAEERLGVARTVSTNPDSDADVMQTIEDGAEHEDVLDPDQYYQDSELWTEASENDEEEPVTEQDPQDNQQPDASGDEDDPTYHVTYDEESQEARHRQRRRKGQMERNFQRVHDAYLEAMDREMSRVEEIQLWDDLEIPPPTAIKDEEIEIPRQPVIKRRLSDTANWRDRTEYQALWERGFDAVQPEEFAKMQERGEQGRKRRRLAYNYLESQGLVTLKQSRTENVLVKKKPPATDHDVEMIDAREESVPTSATEVFADGVPRKKLPSAVVSRAQSRASSVREGSYDTFHRSIYVPRGDALAKKMAERKANEEKRKAQEEEEKAEEERANEARLTSMKELKAMTDEEGQKVRKKRQMAKAEAKQKKQKAREQRQEMEEQEKKTQDEEQGTKEERNKERELGREEQQKMKDDHEDGRRRARKTKKREMRKEQDMAQSGQGLQESNSFRNDDPSDREEFQERRSTVEQESAADEQAAQEKDVAQEEQVIPDEAGERTDELHATKEPARETRPRTKKPKRKSGF